MKTATVQAQTGATLEFAQSIFTRGTDVFGPAEIKTVFGIEIPEAQVPVISFTEEDLREARRLGQVLVLRHAGMTMQEIHVRRANKTSDDRPLYYDIDWYKEEPFYTKEPLTGGWQLISRGVMPGSLNQNYFEQTLTLVNYVGQVFGDKATADVLTAIAEFDKRGDKIKTLMDKDWQKAAEQLASLKLNRLFRPSPVEVMWLLSLYEVVNHERLLPNNWTWTNQCSSIGSLVDVGDFDGRGVDVDDVYPRYRDPYLGALFARSAGPLGS